MTRWEYHFIQVTNAPFLIVGQFRISSTSWAAAAGSWSASTCTTKRGSNDHCRILVRRGPYPGARLDVLSPPPQSQANSTAALRFGVKLASLLLAAKRIMFSSGKAGVRTR